MKIEQKPFSCVRDGLTIRGTLWRLPGSERLPGAIVSHEFVENQRSVAKYARVLAEEGYAAFTYDFCGGCFIGKSDGRTRDMTVLTEVADLNAVMDAVWAHPEVAEGKLLLMGCSQGGFVTGITAARRKDDVAKVVLFYPALSIPDDSRHGRMLTYRFDPDAIPEILGRVPITLGRDYAAVAQEMDCFALIADYDGPVLLVHGTGDHVVPLSYSQRAAAVYGARCTFVELQGAGHVFHGSDAEKAKAILREFSRQSREET